MLERKRATKSSGPVTVALQCRVDVVYQDPRKQTPLVRHAMVQREIYSGFHRCHSATETGPMAPGDFFHVRNRTAP